MAEYIGKINVPKLGTYINSILIFSFIVLLYRDVKCIPFIVLLVGSIILKVRSKDNNSISAYEYLFFYLWLIFNERFILFESDGSKYLFAILTIFILYHVVRRLGTCPGVSLLKISFTDNMIDLAIVTLIFGPRLFDVAKRSGVLLSFILFVLLAIWTEMFCRTIIDIMQVRAIKRCTYARKKVLIDNFLLILIIGLYMSIIYYPGVITSDCAGIYRSASDLQDISCRTDIHSFAFTVVIALMIKLFHDYYAITLFMVIAFGISWSFYMYVLSKCGMPYKTTLGLTLFWLSFPSNLYYLICSWKDILFTSSLLLTSALILFFLQCEGQKNKWSIGLLTISSFCTAAFRSNGQIIIIVMMVIMIILSIRSPDIRYRRMSMPFALAVSMVVIFKGPIFSILHAQRSPQSLATLPFVDGIWENIYQDNEVDEEVKRFIEDEIMPIEDFRDAYDSRYTNYYAFPKGYQAISLDNARHAYMLCLKDHPMTTLLARVKRTYNIWFVDPDKRFPSEWIFIDHIAETDILEGEDWQFPVRFKRSRDLFGKLFTGSYIIGYIQQVMARSGSCLVICFILWRHLKIINRKEIVLVVLPGMINLFGLAVGCCFNDYRYTYPMFALTIPFLAVCIYLDGKYKNNKGGGRSY